MRALLFALTAVILFGIIALSHEMNDLDENTGIIFEDYLKR